MPIVPKKSECEWWLCVFGWFHVLCPSGCSQFVLCPVLKALFLVNCFCRCTYVHLPHDQLVSDLAISFCTEIVIYFRRRGN